MKRFRKMSSYIMQDDLLQPRLTVRESMEIAVELKLGHSVDEKDKAAVVSLLRNSEFLAGSTFVRNVTRRENRNWQLLKSNLIRTRF